VGSKDKIFSSLFLILFDKKTTDDTCKDEINLFCTSKKTHAQQEEKIHQ